MKEYRTTRIKKITKKMTILFMIETLFLSTIISSAWAEENLFGNGYRERLDRISNGRDPDVFMSLDRGQKKDIEIKKQLEELVESSRGANADLDRSVQKDSVEKAENSQVFQEEIAQQRQQREQNAAAIGEFQYIAYADGKKEYFKDGLVSSIENEMVTDESGNTSRKDTRNMKYNDKRLITSYEATVTDEFGVTTKVIFDGAEYTPDSVFYGNHVTRANRNLTKYRIREIDAAGNTADRYWQAEKIEGKFVTIFSQKILDPLYGNYSSQRTNIIFENNDPERMTSYREEGTGTDGLAYTLDRTNITYNGKGEAVHYHEVKTVTQLNGGKVKVTTDAQFEYLEAGDGDRILKSILTTTTENPDGSYRIETNTTNYNYDAHNRLIGASGVNQFTGQEAQWYEYTDTQGHILSRNVDKDGKVTYSYSVAQQTIIVPAEEVIATLKDGNFYTESSKTRYETLQGKLMAAEGDSTTHYYNTTSLELIKTDVSHLAYNNGLVNNLPRLINTQEYTETIYTLLDSQGNPQRGIRDITTTYIYAENGNLSDAQGKGGGLGYELTGDGWMSYSGEITVDYEVILAETKQKQFKEVRGYGNGTKKQLTK